MECEESLNFGSMHQNYNDEVGDVFLSKISLNPKSIKVRSDLADCYKMHKTVLGGFPQINEKTNNQKSARAYFDILYRIDESISSNRIFLLVQSNTEPDWTFLPKKYTLENERDKGFIIKNIEGLLLKIKKNSVFRFKLRANPTQRKFNKNKKGMRIPLVNEQDQIEWLQRKGILHGFRILSLNQNIPNACEREEIIYKGKKREKNDIHILSFYSIVFEGLIGVVDEEKFIVALKKGVGSGKSFGFGLITLASP